MSLSSSIFRLQPLAPLDADLADHAGKQLQNFVFEGFDQPVELNFVFLFFAEIFFSCDFFSAIRTCSFRFSCAAFSFSLFFVVGKLFDSIFISVVASWENRK